MVAFLSHHPPVRLVPWFFDHSPPSSTEVKKEWRYTSTPLHAFMAWTGKLYVYLLKNYVFHMLPPLSYLHWNLRPALNGNVFV